MRCSFWVVPRKSPGGRLDKPFGILLYYAPESPAEDPRGRKSGARRDKPCANTKGNEAMNERTGRTGGSEHGVRYARFVNRATGGWQMAAEAVCAVLFAAAVILSAACFD